MIRSIPAIKFLAILMLAATATAQESAPKKQDSPSKEDAAKPKAEKPADLFIRIRRDEKKRPQALETSVLRMEKANRWPGAVVDLIGALHIGELSYYQDLNKKFKEYDAVLYEVVKPEDAEVPRPGDRPEETSPISALQTGMKDVLDLQFQLDHIDYTKRNLVHADMTPEELGQAFRDEFSKSTTPTAQGFLDTLASTLGGGSADQQANASALNIRLMMALASSDRARRVKIIFAEQLLRMDEEMKQLGGILSGALIEQRNKKCLDVMERELKNGKKRIAIFYGAGHFPDIEKQLREKHGFTRGQAEWVSAWDLTRSSKSAAPEKAQPAKKPSAK
jgi:hypothetical protein